MMNLPNAIHIRCNNCGCDICVEPDSLECDTSVYERDMGSEIEYDFHGNICCDRCCSCIDFNIRGYEYPVGSFNFSDYYCYGGEFLSKPNIEIDYQFDEDYCDEVYEEYVYIDSQLEYHREKIQNMSPREFEIFVADIFKKLGFIVKITKPTRDGGQDIIATKETPIPYTLIVECKHWEGKHKVDVSVVRSVYGVQMASQANKSMVVTSSKFTRDARRFAESQKTLMSLWDIDDLLKLIMENQWDND